MQILSKSVQRRDVFIRFKGDLSIVFMLNQLYGIYYIVELVFLRKILEFEYFRFLDDSDMQLGLWIIVLKDDYKG